ncbi:MAG: hypothetical protein AB1664_18420 [Thermodesulfobacteriota bacterium]
MRKVFVFLTVLAFGICVALAVSAHTPDPSKLPRKEDRVYCCHGKGKCDNLHTKADCEKEGGKVVKSCKECK